MVKEMLEVVVQRSGPLLPPLEAAPHDAVKVQSELRSQAKRNDLFSKQSNDTN